MYTPLPEVILTSNESKDTPITFVDANSKVIVFDYIMISDGYKMLNIESVAAMCGINFFKPCYV